MDQNQITDNQNVDNDLQKAIDSITNSTSIDPVFSDPVAAPSSVPEGDTGELDEPVGPFPEPVITTHAPQTTEPLAPIDSPSIDDLVSSQLPSEPAPSQAPEPTPSPVQVPEPMQVSEPMLHQSSPVLNTAEVKKAALRDLFPVLHKINVNPLQKFKIYRDIFEELKDYTVLESAYEAAREIPDETARAEALLYLIESIDRM